MDLFTQIITFFLAIAALIFYLLHRQMTYWKRLNVPHIKPHWLYGNARGIGKTISTGDFFRGIYFKLKDQGPVVGAYISFMPFAVVTDLDLIKTILVKEFDVFTNRGFYYNKVDDPPSAHLAAIEDDEWRQLRNKLTPTFTSGKIKLMFPIISKVADLLVTSMSTAASSIEIKEISSRFTFDAVARVSFGIDSDALVNENSEIFQMGQKPFAENSLKRILKQQFPDIARRLHIVESNKEVVDFFTNVVRQTIEYRRVNNVQRNDFLSILMKLLDESKLTFDEVIAQSLVFFLAGFETSASTLTFCIYEMSLHKDVQDKARQSVKKVLEKFHGEFSYEAVAEMQYIEQCVKETLRIHPPAHGTRRIAKRDYKVPKTNITIEKGTSVMISAWGIHFDPDIYPDPYKYNPDRFAPEEVEKRHNYAFLPFGEGPRICIGERFAMIEVKIALAKILLNYELDLDRTKTPVPLEYKANRPLLTPTTGIYAFAKRIRENF